MAEKYGSQQDGEWSRLLGTHILKYKHEAESELDEGSLTEEIIINYKGTSKRAYILGHIL